MKYQAVFFDLDNTLYSYDLAHARAYASLQGLAGRELGLTPERFDELHARASEVLTRRCGGGPAIHDRLLRFQILLELLGRPIWTASALADCYWDGFLRTLTPEPGALELLQRLKSMGLKLGIGTNMSVDMQLEKLRILGMTPYIDLLVTSEEVNAEKPDARLFALCAEKAGAEPARCVFVGDSLTKDAAGAQAAGMQGVWYCRGTPRATPPGVLTLRALRELPALLNTPEGGGSV